MNTEKISNYNLTASIHTMTVTSAGAFEKNDLYMLH